MHPVVPICCVFIGCALSVVFLELLVKLVLFVRQSSALNVEDCH